MARTFALIAPVWRTLQQVLCSSEMVPNAPKRKETHQKMSFGSNGVDRERSLRKIVTRHRCTNFCSNETVANAPNHNKTHQNMSLVSNGVDWVHSLRKIRKRLRCTNFFIKCTSLSHFALSFV